MSKKNIILVLLYCNYVYLCVMEEIWKDINDYIGLYRISNFGRVKSLKRHVVHNYSGFKTLKERILSAKADSNGYCVVVLCRDGNKKTFKVHRLVSVAFIPNPQNKPQVNHKNGIKDYNYFENLEWCDRSENVNHAIKMGFLTYKKGKDHCNYGADNKLSKKVIDTKTGVIFNTIREASETTKYTQKYLGSMLRNERVNKTTLIFYNDRNRSI